MAFWREIAGYEGLYLVSDEGEIYSLPKIVHGYREQHRRGKLLKKGRRGRKGQPQYEFVVLVDANGESHKEAVHRLVAKAFIQNPDGFPEVNHIDEDSLNNCVENLEWCSRQYNVEYSKAKPVVQYNKEHVAVAQYRSIAYASKMTGISRTAINNVLRGWSNAAGGYYWEYEGGNED